MKIKSCINIERVFSFLQCGIRSRAFWLSTTGEPAAILATPPRTSLGGKTRQNGGNSCCGRGRTGSTWIWTGPSASRVPSWSSSMTRLPAMWSLSWGRFSSCRDRNYCHFFKIYNTKIRDFFSKKLTISSLSCYKLWSVQSYAALLWDFLTVRFWKNFKLPRLPKHSQALILKGQLYVAVTWWWIL